MYTSHILIIGFLDPYKLLALLALLGETVFLKAHKAHKTDKTH